MNLNNILWVYNTRKILPKAPVVENFFGMNLIGDGIITTATGNPVSIVTNKAQNAISTLISFPESVDGISSVSVDGCGKNLFDKDNDSFVTGYLISATGEITANPAYSYCQSYINVKGDTNYIFSGDIVYTGIYNSVSFYDSDKIFISRFVPSTPGENAKFTTPLNARYIRFNASSNPDLLKPETIQLELGSTATAYEPYTQVTSLAISLGDTFYNGGEVDLENGVVTADGVEHSITPQTVDLLAGNNTLWTNGDSLSITYRR